MSTRAAVVWTPQFLSYDLGDDHPLDPVRLDLTMRLATELGVMEGVEPIVPEPAPDDEIQRIHVPSFLSAVKSAPEAPFGVGHGLGTDDNPIFFGMHEASALICGGSLAAAREIAEGRAERAVNIAGGLHHAMADRAAGFCVYNDCAVAISWLLDHGFERIAYVDVDVHHGDGVECIFYDDPRVLTISLHETGQMLFPGTGFPRDTGGPNAPGSAVNVALPPGTGDAGWLRAFHAVVPPLVREFAPDILVTQGGCDSHIEDPLAHLMLTVDGQRAAFLALHDLAHEVCGGKWVSTGGGGYAVVDVVPRTWTHLLAIVGGSPLAPETATPEEWREHVRVHLGRTPPFRLTDGRAPDYRDWAEGYDPSSWLDRAIHATREASFPLNGLDYLP